MLAYYYYLHSTDALLCQPFYYYLKDCLTSNECCSANTDTNSLPGINVDITAIATTVTSTILILVNILYKTLMYVDASSLLAASNDQHILIHKRERETKKNTNISLFFVPLVTSVGKM